MLYLGDSPENLFQRIKRSVREYEAEHGAGSSINIAVGEPDTNPPLALRTIVADFVMKDENWVHTYWDNRDPDSFASGMVERITGVRADKYDHLDTLVLPGEKSMLGLLPIACAAKSHDVFPNEGFVKTAPAYDLLGTWSDYIDTPCYTWPLTSEENFKLNLNNLPKREKPPRMIITVKPGNPCPAGATREEWAALIEYCIDHNVRLVNDGAYTSLNHSDHVSLSEVAKDYPGLDWMELFSISKTLSACGWRLGAAVGSQDFIGELTKIKGNADSGPFGPALAGADDYFQSEQSATDITSIEQMYADRLAVAIPLLKNAGFKLACPTDAGFFMLFHCPKTVDGQVVADSEEFNELMINKIGLVGVPFTGAEVGGQTEQFIRYSVCSDFTDSEFAARVESALDQVELGY